MTPAEAETLLTRILEDMDLTPHSKTRYHARRLRECFQVLRAEAFTLAAGACEHKLGDEGGNPYCGRTGAPL